MSASRLGKAAERRVRDDLTANGYTIQQAHLSRGPADFLAGKPGQVLAVQVKRSVRSGGGVGPVEWNALVDLSASFSAVPVVAFASPRKPVVYMRVTGRKSGRGRQPWRVFLLDEVAA